MENDGLLKFLLGMFTIIGINPTSNNLYAKVSRKISIVSMIFLNVLYLLDIILNWNGVQSLGKINTYPAVVMMLIKTFVLQFKSKTLNQIINQVRALRAFKTNNDEVKKRLKTAYNLAKLFTITFLVMCCVTVIIFAAMPFLTNDLTLYFDTYWFCDKSTNPCFSYHFIWQHYIICIAIPSVLGFDCLFVYFVSVVYCSIEVAKESFKELDFEFYNKRKLRDAVDKHNQIVRFIKVLNTFYSNLMLAQSCCSLGALILSLYVMTSEGIPPPLRLLTKFGTLIIVYCFQFLIYSIAGTVIIEQTKTISESAFFVDWSSKTKGDLRRALVLVIQRSQKVEKISVGGIMDLNLECFVWVLRNSLSVYTLLLTVEKKSQLLK